MDGRGARSPGRRPRRRAGRRTGGLLALGPAERAGNGHLGERDAGARDSLGGRDAGCDGGRLSLLFEKTRGGAKFERRGGPELARRWHSVCPLY